MHVLPELHILGQHQHRQSPSDVTYPRMVTDRGGPRPGAAGAMAPGVGSNLFHVQAL
jgi:hypothetical protein